MHSGTMGLRHVLVSRFAYQNMPTNQQTGREICSTALGYLGRHCQQACTGVHVSNLSTAIFKAALATPRAML